VVSKYHSLCSASPCLNDGSCTVDVNGEAVCACNGEWSGFYCSGLFYIDGQFRIFYQCCFSMEVDFSEILAYICSCFIYQLVADITSISAVFFFKIELFIDVEIYNIALI
jgi:hypothetical protein